MKSKQRHRIWIAGGTLIAVVYACSGSPDAVLRPSGDGDGEEGGQGADSGRGGSGTGAVIDPRGGKGGRGGTSGTGSGAETGDGGDNGRGGRRDAGLPDSSFDYDASSGGEGGACAVVTGEGRLVKKPMDIIIAIDNSASMQGEIQAVQARINVDFAQIIQASGIDYRVVMVSRYGNIYVENYDGGMASDSAYSICVGSPLSALTCPASANATTPPIANNPPRFFHHSTNIGSNNMWCRLLGSFDVNDPYPTARSGWSPVLQGGWGRVLRPEAFKVFIGITDDSPNRVSGGRSCNNMRSGDGLVGSNNQTGATNFDTALRNMAPTQFNSPDGARNYVWYSIVGMAGNATMNPTPLGPTDPVVGNCCTASGGVDTSCEGDQAPAGDGAGPGQGYQYLSIMTGGLRYPSCYNSNFNAIFNVIAQGVIDRATASCEYQVPPNPNGIIDPDLTTVSYRPGAGAPMALTRVASETACTAGGGFYFNPALDRLFLCPATCTTVQADPMARISIDFGCLGS